MINGWGVITMVIYGNHLFFICLVGKTMKNKTKVLKIDNKNFKKKRRMKL